MSDAPILVTGGAGFIGSTLVRHLLANSGTDRVVVVDALTYAGHLASLASVRSSPRFFFEQGDVANAAQMEAIFRRHRPRAVFHLAAESHVDRSIDGPAAFVHTNVVGTFTMLEQAQRHWSALPHDGEARQTFRFVHVSTDEVFGALESSGSFVAGSAYRPTSPYAASKAASDHFARAWKHTYGLPVVVTTCSNNYGPYQFPEKLIPLAIRKAHAGDAIPVYGRGNQVRDWLHVDDHVAALVAAWRCGEPGATYLFGGRTERTNLQVVETICDLLDERLPGDAPRRALIAHVADRPGHDFRYANDATAAEQALGWRPLIDFTSGLRATVEWFLSHESWCEEVQGATYQGQRLGLGVAA